MPSVDVEKEGDLHGSRTGRSYSPKPDNPHQSGRIHKGEENTDSDVPTASSGLSSRDKAPLQQNRSHSDRADGDTSPDVRHSIRDIEKRETYDVDWDGEDDPLDPRNIHWARKWLVTFILAFCSMCVTCTSSLYTTTYDQIEPELGVSRIVATLGLSLFVFGLGLSPLVLGPLSEFYGRRRIYIGSFVLFAIWLIPCAEAHNIETMLIARFFDGLSGGAFLSVAGGTIGDMFTKEKLQAPMMIYTASPFFGPSVAPIIGGFINSFLDWRWSFYVLLIWSGVMLSMIITLVPETYPPAILRAKAQRLRKETGDQGYKAPMEKMERSIPQTVLRSLYRPFLMLALDPMCLNLCLFSSLLLGILYLFFGAFNLVFSATYGFNLYQVGLSFCGLLVGMLVAVASDPFWQKNYSRLVRKNSGISEPEFRLPPSIMGSLLTVIGLFVFAWTMYPTVHWVVPMVGAGFFGGGTILVFSGIFTFLVEAFPLYAASALAANSFARSSFAAVFPLFGIQMYNKLGFQWASSLLAFLTLAMAPFPYIFYIYGKRLRQRSRFSSSSESE